MLADENCRYARLRQQPGVSVTVDSTFANDYALLRDLPAQLDCMVQVRFKRFQVAVVDANQRRTRVEYTLEIVGFIKLNERRHTKFDRLVM